VVSRGALTGQRLPKALREKKSLVKASEAPARRYIYYLTPQGFAEKPRLKVEYLWYSFCFLRQAKEDCALLFAEAHTCGLDRAVLVADRI